MRIIQEHHLLKQYLTEDPLKDFLPKQYQDFLFLAEYRSGEPICQQGASLETLYFFVHGKIKIIRTLPSGKEYVLDIRENPCILGEIEFMTLQPLVSSVVTMKKSLVIHFPIAGRRETLMHDAGFLYRIGRCLALELYQLDAIASVNVLCTVKERLGMYILSVQKDGWFSLELSALADAFGTSYRHLLRVVNLFLEKGFIEKVKNTYHILDEAGLKTYASIQAPSNI